MMQRERSDVYIIPPNFAKEGTLFSGRIEGRNAFEAAVLFIILFRILFFIDVSIKIRIYIGIIVILPLTILAVVGVNGESLLSFIIQFIRFVTRRRVVTVPDGQYRLKRNRRIRRQQKKQQKQERKKKKRQQEGGVKDRKRSRRIEAKAERSSACRETRTAGAEATAERRQGDVQEAGERKSPDAEGTAEKKMHRNRKSRPGRISGRSVSKRQKNVI